MPQKILHISTSDSGGAGKACIRLHNQLFMSGLDSKVLVLDKSLDENIGVFQFDEIKNQGKAGKAWSFFKRHITPAINDFKLSGKVGAYELFSFTNSLFDITKHPYYKEADIIHLHFTSQFLDYKSFFRQNTKPIVWTLHDMNAFTGGCHYSAGCKSYVIKDLNQKKHGHGSLTSNAVNAGNDNCRICPQLAGAKSQFYSRKILKRKIVLLKTQDITIVCPSVWLLEKSMSSMVFQGKPHFLINHGVDLKQFKPMEKDFSRRLYNLPLNKKILLFVADDFSRKNKGFDILDKALSGISYPEGIIWCTAGRMGEVLPSFKNHVHLGQIKGDRLLSLLYSAADLTVVPSREEAFSLVTLESLACGTPVVTFSGTGPDDLIHHGINGWLAKPYEHEELRAGIEMFLSDHEKKEFNSKNLRKTVVDSFSVEEMARKYKEVYEKKG